MNSQTDSAHCASCGKILPSSQLVEVTDDDTQGYARSGIKVCSRCLSDIRYEAFQLEDEDVYDVEDE